MGLDLFFSRIRFVNVLKDCPKILEEFNLLEDSDECIAFYIWY